jgi:CNT family concentrative nucleoside transporter
VSASTAALQSAVGFVALHAIAWGLSERRRDIVWRPVLVGAMLTVALAALCLYVAPVRAAFASLTGVATAVETATRAGTSLVFGFLGGGALPYAETTPGASFVLALRALPVVLVTGALSALLFHWGVLGRVVGAFAWVLQRALGVGGAVGVAAAANVFVGMVEAPLLVRPWLATMTRGELFSVMTTGMATIAGTVLFLYATLLASVVPDALGQLLVASVVSVPASIAVAALMVPLPAANPARDADAVRLRSEATGSFDALVRAIESGVSLLLVIVAMLLVFVALANLVDQMLAWAPAVAGAPLSLARMVGWFGAPLAWLVGVPWSEATVAGQLLGEKTVLNEFVAYLHLAALPPDALSPRSRVLMTWALCGFANVGSLGILVGGLAAMAPARRIEIVALGARSVLSGTLATCITGAAVGLLGAA